MNEKIFETIKTLIHEVRPERKEMDIDSASSLRNDLGLDSVDVMSFVFELEDVFKIKISDEDLEKYNLDIVSKLIEFVEKKTSEL